MLYSAQEIEDEICKGDTVYLSNESEVVLDRPINITQPTTIVGGKLRVNGTPAFDIKSSGVDIDRVTIRGSGTSTARKPEEKLILATGAFGSPLYEVNVRNSKFYNSSSDNIYFSYVEDSDISNNRIRDYLYSGVMMISCKDSSVSENRISDSRLSSGVVNNYGIAATDVLNTFASRSENISITGNIVQNIEWEGIDTHSGKRISVKDNIVLGCNRGIAIVVGNDTRLCVPTDCTIVGNTVDGYGSSREGISLFGLPGKPADAVIQGNRVTGHADLIVAYYYDRAKTAIGGNNVPHKSWTDISLANGWTANSVYKPQYMVDGETVFLRGMVIPPATMNGKIGTISTAFTPANLAFIRQSKGSNASAGEGTVAMTPAGELMMYYYSINDRYSYPIEGQYRMI